MSCTVAPPPRKRTSSFSTPKPKSQRMAASSLRRTSSYITLPDMLPIPQPDNTPAMSLSASDCSALVLRHYKEQRQRQRRRAQAATPTTPSVHFTIGPSPPSSSLPLPPPAPILLTTTTTTTTTTPQPPPRATSPLSPTQKLLPPRASFPRSKQSPNLYKIAITTRMRCSPEGQKILSMGPRLAVSILTATRELEQIVAAQMGAGRMYGAEDGDVTMADGTAAGCAAGMQETGRTLSKSWIVVPGSEDWEMVDCSA